MTAGMYASDILREVIRLMYLWGIDLHGLLQELLSFTVQAVVEQQVGCVDERHVFVLRWSWVQGLAQTLQSLCTVSLSSPKEPSFILNQPPWYIHLHAQSKKNGFKPNWNYRTVSSIHPDSAHLKIVSLHVSGRVSFAEKKSAVQSVFFPLTPANVEQKWGHGNTFYHRFKQFVLTFSKVLDIITPICSIVHPSLRFSNTCTSTNTKSRASL